ncbi:fimbrial protein [Salmonella enterica subsp. salamae]|uniref:Fimbrial protein n=3 Tax=Salmonella enterica TaxID=28901 RepID=A0A379QFG9_SALER|nr:fimbrial protein [Salmonella enterica]ECC1480105.1 fimbrial protein [Salmonella enterica subsp. salamae]EHM1752513.1 fimbrial protein [Salmonella enterica subsp. salamae serovar 40:c:e,n,x,z15]ASG86548.1 fimbrial protein [Salmonella enterica subsp. salamae serovar 55:k:z39 str. 1315K]ECC1655284.1 fimbrial protein [Salmonella enterica subsp. salamae]ECC1692447.1 fimbrial protein [Salmonella enterica subsp. salamae]
MIKRHTRQVRKAGAALLLCVAATWPVRAADNVHFSGRLVASACTLILQGVDAAAVDFAQLDSADFIPSGQSARKPLIFELTDCDSALSGGVQVTFAGAEAPGSTGILAIDNGSMASGIGIGIETLAGAPVAMNDASGATFTLSTGNNTLRLNAWVQRLPGDDLKPGTFTATATATFEYL